MKQLPEMFKQPYNPADHESAIYKMWEESGYFNPDVCVADGVTDAAAEPFSMVLPPPNVTGQLHIGHAMMIAIEDALSRYSRMQGKRTLWLPGTDHAAIATESKVTKLLEKKKIRKREIGREEFLKHVEEFAAESAGNIQDQARQMGASLDWSREAFTLDETRQEAVVEAFRRLYEMGLIYRGHRIVNWDPKGQTTISDDEIVRKEEVTKFYYFQYGPFVIGTARPETKFADKYIIVHPDDERYVQYKHMQQFEVEWINGPITATLIKDEVADPEKGSGAMTITPWHSQIDFELAEKYDLPKEQIIDKYGKLLPIAGEEFRGMKIAQAREAIVAKLDKKGLVVKIEDDYVNQQATAERTGAVIEPQIMDQWFIGVNRPFTLEHSEIDGIASGSEVTLKELMLHVIKSGQIGVLPERFVKTYYNWVENLRDWCISRQIWYGHQIPVWKKGGEIVISRTSPGVVIDFVRHAESEFNAQGKLAGTIDSPLSELGKQQANELAQKLANENKNYDLIISSALSRCRQTAEIVADKLGVSVLSFEQMNEVDWGDLQGMQKSLLEGDFLELAVSQNTGEGYEGVETRAWHTIGMLLEKAKDKKVLVVGHSTFMSIVCAINNDVDREGYRSVREQLDFKNAEINAINVIDKAYEQDPDTLDTWFSSGLWTFSTLGWPNQTDDLKTYHPTSVLETGYDIIFFWNARMILMATALLGQIPFKNMYFHGLVRDAKGRKISKSLGNNIDPRDMIQKYGTDAVRMSLIVGVGAGVDANFSEDKVRAYKKFANKIWNASRFVMENTNEVGATELLDGSAALPEAAPQPYHDHLADFRQAAEKITGHFENFRYHLAAEEMYHYFWHTFADVVIEGAKEDLAGDASVARTSAQTTLAIILRDSLKILHPFMPFLTETIWQAWLEPQKQQMLQVAKWPSK